jgi:hypothetical protein
MRIISALTFILSLAVNANATTYTPLTSAQLQSNVNSAAPGDTITLAHGVRYSFASPNGLVLPQNSATCTGVNYITVTTDRPGDIPASGVRVTATDAALMPEITTASDSSAGTILTSGAANCWKFYGVKITSGWTGIVFGVNAIIQLGGNNTDGLPAVTLAQLPTNFTVVQCYIDSVPTAEVIRSFSMDGINTTVIDSVVRGAHSRYLDAQGVFAYNTPGALRIENNDIVASTENILFGGGDPRIPGITPSDISIRYNHIFKLLSWKSNDPTWDGINWNIKNLIETKHAQRVLIERNLLEYCWNGGQYGTALVFTLHNQDHQCPQCTVNNIVVDNNYIRNVGQGIIVYGHSPIAQGYSDGGQPPCYITAISVANPTVITCSNNHGFANGQSIVIVAYRTPNLEDSTPTVNGDRVVTVIDATHFSVPVNVTVAGTKGYALKGAGWGDKRGYNFSIYNNVLDNVNPTFAIFSDPKFLAVYDDVANLVVDHNTHISAGDIAITSSHGVDFNNSPCYIASQSVSNPTTITCTSDSSGLNGHHFVTGDIVTVAGQSGSTPSINGTQTVTRTGLHTFTIPVNTTVAGSGGYVLPLGGTPTTGHQFTNNLFSLNSYGIFGSGTGVGDAVWAAFAPDAVVNHNIGKLPNGNPYDQSYYTASKVTLVSESDFATYFVDPNTGNYTVKPGTLPYHAAADTSSLGANMCNDAFVDPAGNGSTIFTSGCASIPDVAPTTGNSILLKILH